MTNSLIIWKSEEVAAPAAEAMAMKSMALEAFEAITAVASDAENAAATVHVEDATRLMRDVETARKALVAKPWAMCAAVNKAARDFIADLETERTRVNKLCGNFIQDKLEVQREAERARDRELARIEQARIDEERRIELERIKAEAARIAELRRIEAEAEAARAKAQAALDAEANTAKSKKAKAEAAVKQAVFEAEQCRLSKLRQAEAVAEVYRQEQEQVRSEAGRAEREAMAAQEKAAVPEVAPLEKAAGQVVKARWTFEVLNILELSKVRPDLVKMEPRTAEINELINALGVREMRGIRIFEEVKTSTRQSKGPKFLDV